MAQMEVKPEIIENNLLKVPFEALKRAAKDRKGLVDEATDALKSLSSLDSSPHDQQLAGLDQLVSRLQGLKRKLVDVSRAERDEASRCKARVEHLAALGTPARGATVAWNRPRLDRILVDHLLRSDCHVTAAALAASARIEPLCDLHVFGGARRVSDALRARDAAPALAWCEEQRARLKKAKSPLEFKLRLQEFIELLRKVRARWLGLSGLMRCGAWMAPAPSLCPSAPSGLLPACTHPCTQTDPTTQPRRNPQEQRLEAIAYARRHLAPWAPQHMPELQRALGALAFGPRSRCSRYAPLFEDGAWQELVELFHRELYRLAALPPESLLTVHMQVCATAAGEADFGGPVPFRGLELSAARKCMWICKQQQQQQQRSASFSPPLLAPSKPPPGGPDRAQQPGGVPRGRQQGGPAAPPLIQEPNPGASAHAVQPCSSPAMHTVYPCTQYSHPCSTAMHAAFKPHGNPLLHALSMHPPPRTLTPPPPPTSPPPPSSHPQQGLPHAKHVHSTLVCAVTREVMSDANPPMVLPNGCVYSKRAVEQLTAAHGGGRLQCPKTGATCGVDELRRAFIV